MIILSAKQKITFDINNSLENKISRDRYTKSSKDILEIISEEIYNLIFSNIWRERCNILAEIEKAEVWSQNMKYEFEVNYAAGIDYSYYAESLVSKYEFEVNRTVRIIYLYCSESLVSKWEFKVDRAVGIDYSSALKAWSQNRNSDCSVGINYSKRFDNTDILYN
ncbi:hypothetical protein C1645_806597 [Glomus cerebriforme]|uniref:Uncharacterized protein n=1 Tax=Glomus cerebriforme TaxID=658196 RepID=A0A397T0X1_9GLOM|nr:hypothetical protein C1645_806597 [Glomus cerebriforme]